MDDPSGDNFEVDLSWFTDILAQNDYFDGMTFPTEFELVDETLGNNEGGGAAQQQQQQQQQQQGTENSLIPRSYSAANMENLIGLYAALRGPARQLVANVCRRINRLGQEPPLEDDQHQQQQQPERPCGRGRRSNNLPGTAV